MTNIPAGDRIKRVSSGLKMKGLSLRNKVSSLVFL